MQEVNNTIHFLFHQPDFVFRQGRDQILTFEEGTIQIHFTVSNNQLISLSKSPFGGFNIPVGYDEKLISLERLLKHVEQYANQHNISRIEIRGHPDVYSQRTSAVVGAQLTTAGYSILYQDVAQVLYVSENEPDFNTHRKRRMRHGVQSGFSFVQLAKANMPDAYLLIQESRNIKGYPVTMTVEELLWMMELFPEQYLLFGVRDKEKLIATCVAIRVAPSILYCFYIGDALLYRKFSPVTLLIKGIYDFCRDHAIHLMDLGISTERGVMNSGLFAFKKSLGAQTSNKFTFQKIIA